MNEKVKILFLVLMLALAVTLVVSGHAWALIPMVLAYLIIYFTFGIIKARRDVKRGKEVDGFNVCYHNYQLMKTKTVTYGVDGGVVKDTYSTYKCTKCGKIAVTTNDEKLERKGQIEPKRKEKVVSLP